jgi:pilus assembly protein CpaE
MAMDKVNVFVISGQDELRNAVAGALAHVEYINLAGETASAAEALHLVEANDPDVILIDALIEEDGYKLAESLSGICPETALVILESELKEETMRRAIFSGAKDVLIYPFPPAKLIDSIYRSYQNLKKTQQSRTHDPQRQRKKFQQGQLAVVFSTKGGVGKTFLATNLAFALARENGAKVVLVDLDLDFGNASLALDIAPRYTISNVVNEIANLDRDLIESFLIPHPSGIWILAANVQPRMNEFINANHVETILKLLQSSFDFVVVDMPSRFSSTLDPVFQMSDMLLLVTTPEVSTIRNLKACLNTLDSLNFSTGKTRLILNKEGLSVDIRTKDVETTLGHPLYGSLPLDIKLVTDSMNKGIPIGQLYPRSKITRSVENLADKITKGASAG